MSEGKKGTRASEFCSLSLSLSLSLAHSLCLSIYLTRLDVRAGFDLVCAASLSSVCVRKHLEKLMSVAVAIATPPAPTNLK